MDTDVLVVGAGPVGLAAAWFLARQGVGVRIIDQSQGPATESRAVGIQARTLEILEMAGAVDEFLSLGHRLEAVNLFGESGGRIGRVAFGGLPTRYPFLMTLPQDQTERILAAHLADRGIHVERRTTLVAFTEAGPHVSATVHRPDGTDETIQCGWLIGADGAHSTVRQVLGMGFKGKTYDLKFLLADLHLDSPLPESDAHVFARSYGLLAIFPLGGGRHRLVADNPPGPFAEDQRPTLAEWQAVVDRRTSMPIHLSQPDWMSYFRVHARIVEHLRRGRVFLMGDAAHIHSPALAQGMNTGIHDAWNLAWKLSLVSRGAAGPDLLDSYEAERLPVERRVLGMTDFTQNVVATPSRLRQVLRDLLLPIAIHIPFVQEKAAETVSELSVGYRGSPIVEDHPLAGAPHAGDRAPDAGMIDEHGNQITLARLMGLRHVLLGLDHGKADPKTPAIAEVLRQAAKQYPELLDAYVIRPGGGAEAEHDIRILKPIDDEFAQRYGTESGYLLIRPDGYIAFRSPAASDNPLTDFLDRTLHGPSRVTAPLTARPQ